jgi:hypothetical protein
VHKYETNKLEGSTKSGVAFWRCSGACLQVLSVVNFVSALFAGIKVEQNVRVLAVNTTIK